MRAFLLVLVLYSVLLVADIFALQIQPIEFSRGRFDLRDWHSGLFHVPEARFDWSGATISTHIACDNSGNSVSFGIDMTDGGNQYNVELFTAGSNKRVAATVLKTKNNRNVNSYEVKLGPLPKVAQTYRLYMSKRTEARFGIVRFRGFQIHGSSCRIVSTTTKTAATRSGNSGLSMEFIGASVMCGYGALGKAPCTYTPDTQNVHAGFGVMLAHKLNVTQNYKVTCWSGRGIVRNYNSPNRTAPDAFPSIYNRTLANQKDLYWDFSPHSFRPRVVVMALGENDYLTQPMPTFAEYYAGYSAFLDRIKHNYDNNVKIILTCVFCTQPYIEQVVAKKNDPNIFFFRLKDTFDPTDALNKGCDNHPSARAHDIMSSALVPFVLKVLNS